MSATSRILIADDEPVNVQLISRYLAQGGFETISARNGREALDSVLQERPDLLLLDISMPVMDGFQVCEQLRSNMRTRSIPIIFLTARHELQNRLKGFSLGGDDYILKPFDMEELQARVTGCLQRARRDLWSHPLTHLPGSPGIMEEVRKRLLIQKPFAFAYIDIDHFKAFNDVYGYEAGDQVIMDVANLLIDQSQTAQGQNAFPGHVGGDDFVWIADIDRLANVLPTLLQQFDLRRQSHYRAEDWQRGSIQAHSRQGSTQTFPLMTLSAAVVSTATRHISHYARLVEIATELKQYVKSLDHQGQSLCLWDRRKDVKEKP